MAVMRDIRGTVSVTGDTPFKRFFGRDMNYKFFWLNKNSCVSGRKWDY